MGVSPFGADQELLERLEGFRFSASTVRVDAER